MPKSHNRLHSLEAQFNHPAGAILIQCLRATPRRRQGCPEEKILSRFQRFSGDTFLPFAGSLLQSLARLFGCSFTSLDGDESTWDGMVGVAVNPRRPFRALPWL